MPVSHKVRTIREGNRFEFRLGHWAVGEQMENRFKANALTGPTCVLSCPWIVLSDGFRRVSLIREDCRPDHHILLIRVITICSLFLCYCWFQHLGFHGTSL